MPEAKEDGWAVLARLAQVIEARRGADAADSYTAALLEAGVPKVARKLGEEAVETIIAALGHEPEALARESADLLYHLLVLWAAAGLDPAAVFAELSRREGMSGLAEKRGRGPAGGGDD